MNRVNEARISTLFVIGLSLLGVTACGDDSGTVKNPIDPDDGTSGAGASGGSSGAGAGGSGAGSGGRTGEGGASGASGEGGAGSAAPIAGRGTSGSGGSNGGGSGGVTGGDSGRGGSAAGSGGGSGAGGSDAPDDDAGVDEGEPEAGRGGSGGRGGRGGSGGRSGSGGGGSGGDEGEAGRGGRGGNGGGGTGGVEAGSGGSGGDEGEAGSGGRGEGPRCGTRGGSTCDDDEFCNFEPDEDCGGTDRGGVCEDRPEFCTAIYEPVCGCDNRTYGNACEAHGNGVSAKREGLCEPEECEAAGGRVERSDGASTPSCEPGEDNWQIESGGDEPAVCCLGDDEEEPTGETCGGIAALECDDVEFCNYAVEAGGQGCDGSVSDAAGVCQARPAFCTRQFAPVCGCDRVSYGNECEANAMGASVLHDGACTVSDCEDFGGTVEYGIGLPAVCDPGQRQLTYVVEDSGAIPIEGAVCCIDD